MRSEKLFSLLLFPGSGPDDESHYAQAKRPDKDGE